MSTLVNPNFSEIDPRSGAPLSGGLLYTYYPGGSSPKITYSNKALTTPNANPVVLNAAGEALVYGSGNYRLVLTASDGYSVWTVDNVDGIGTTTLVTIDNWAGSWANALSALGTTNPAYLIIDMATTLTVNTTVPSNVQVWVVDGGSVALAGYNMTINGPFSAGNFQVFSGTGTVTFGAGAITQAANPKWWGGGSSGATKANTASANVIVTFTSNSTTPDVSSQAPVFITNNSQATVITTFSNMVAGQTWDVIVADSGYTTFGGTIRNVPLSVTQYTTLSFLSDGTYAYCISPPQAATPIYRNRLINGEMRIDQRNNGASQTITTSGGNQYTVDRWFGLAFGANVTGQQVSGTGQFKNYYQFTGATNNTFAELAQRIESINIMDLAGQTVTFSVYLASSTVTTIYYDFYYPNATDNWTGQTQIGSQGSWTITSTMTRYTTTITLPSGAAGGLEVLLVCPNLTSGTWSITGAQLESGSVSTAFERRPDDVELLRCQRYLPAWRLPASISFFAPMWTGTVVANGASGYAYINIPFPATTRVYPTTISANLTAMALSPANFGAVLTPSNLTFVNNGSNYNVMLQANCANIGPAGQTTVLWMYGGGYLYLAGAEL